MYTKADVTYQLDLFYLLNRLSAPYSHSDEVIKSQLNLEENKICRLYRNRIPQGKTNGLFNCS